MTYLLDSNRYVLYALKLKLWSLSHFSEAEDDNANDNNIRDTGPKEVLKLADRCDDPEINSDANFLDDLELLFNRHQTSKLFTPFSSQLKVVRNNARRSLKKRIEQKLKVRI